MSSISRERFCEEETETMEHLRVIFGSEQLIVVATGKYVEEGFDLPRLDTLMLVLPVSWKG